MPSCNFCDDCTIIPINTNPSQNDIYIDFSTDTEIKKFVLSEYIRLIKKRKKIEKKIKKTNSKKNSKKCSKSNNKYPKIISIFLNNDYSKSDDSDSSSSETYNELEKKIIDSCNCSNSRYFFKLKNDLYNGVSYWFANIYVKIPYYVDNTIKLGMYLRYLRETNKVKTFIIDNNLTGNVKRTAQIGSTVQTFYTKNDVYNAAFKNYLKTNDLNGTTSQVYLT